MSAAAVLVYGIITCGNFLKFNLIHKLIVFLYQFDRPAARRRRRYRDAQKVKPEISSSNNRNDLTTRRGKRVNYNESDISFRSLSNNSDDTPPMEIPDSRKKPPSPAARVHLIEKTSEAVKSSVPQRKLVERTRSLEKPSKPQRSVLSVHRLNKTTSVVAAKKVDVTKSSNNSHSSSQINTNNNKSKAETPKEQPAIVSAVTVRKIKKIKRRKKPNFE